MRGRGGRGAPIVVGDPVDEIEQRWDEFKSGRGRALIRGEPPGQQLGRLLPLDLWRVAWENFEREPITGVGADNFLRDYLQRGDTDDPPSYPHSLEFRVLSQTGIVGFLLLGGAFVAGLWRRSRRCGTSPRRGAAGAAVLGFPIGWCTGRSTGSASSRAWAPPRSRCWASRRQWPRPCPANPA